MASQSSEHTTPPGPSGLAAASVLELAAAQAAFDRRRAHREDGAAAGLSRLREAANRDGAQALAAALDTPSGQIFFAFLFGNSPHLGSLLMRDVPLAQALVTDAPQTIAERIEGELAEANPQMERADLMRFLRVQRNRVAVMAGVCDCFDVWGVMRSAALLSSMADHATRLAIAHLLRASAAQGDLGAPEGERWGYFALAMGKHGSGELNYSSDIDLIVLYDPERCDYRGRRPLREHFARLTRELISLLEERTADGYVFRTDLRLRPDPSSTPPAITVDFALGYYQRVGRTWERAAMIKARPVAGDIEAGERFLSRLAPFIWDEALDFRSVEEIRSMSEQIHDFHGHGDIKLPGWNVKLGRGGIREIEFFVHMHQLAHGGVSQRLRGKQVLPMLATLEREHHILPSEAQTLQDAYVLLRRVEHRLQMTNDNQTQTLPAADDGLDHIAAFMNMASPAELGALLGDAAREVHALYLARFNVPEREHDIAESILTGPEGLPDAHERLREAGFQDAERAFEVLRGWAEGRHPATADEGVRAMIRDVLHDLTEALGKTPHPDAALKRLDAFLAALPEDIAFFSMLRANAWLSNLIAVVMGGAPRIADRLAANPRLLQAALDPSFFLPIADKAGLVAELDERLGSERDFRRRVGRIARWADDRRFQVGVQTLQHLVTLAEGSSSRSHVAEAVVATLLRDAEADFARRRQGAELPACVVVALGDLGAKDMIFGSPLHLLFVADGGEGGEAMRNARRIARRLEAALRRDGGAGQMYPTTLAFAATDALERASLPGTGRAVAGELEQAHRLIALCRARVICGDAGLAETVSATLQAALCAAENPAGLPAAIAALESALVQDRSPDNPFAVRAAAGGLLQLELVARLLQLRHAPQAPETLARGLSVPATFAALANAQALAADAGEELAQAYVLQRAVQDFLRLTLTEAEGRDVAAAPPALRQRMAEAFECDAFEDVTEGLLAAQRAGAAAWREHVR